MSVAMSTRGLGKMMLVKIDRVAPQVFQAGLECVGQVLSAPQWCERKLGGDHHVLALRQLSEAALRTTGAVHSCCIEEGHLRGKARFESCLLTSRIRGAVGALGGHHTLQAARLAPDHDTQSEP